MNSSDDSILARPFVRFGRETTGELEPATRREWLVTNGLGGYASGTVSTLPTRRYHGLLVAALEPPVERTVLVAGSLEWVIVGGRRFPLSTLAPAPGEIEPDGYRFIESFELDGMLPVWRFAIDGAIVERRAWMARERNVTWIGFRLMRGSSTVAIALEPLLTNRDHHALDGPADAPRMDTDVDGFVARFRGRRPAISVRASGGSFAAGAGTWRSFFLAEERARGLDETTRAFVPGTFGFELAPGRLVGLTLSALPAAPGMPAAAIDDRIDLDEALAIARARQHELLERAARGPRAAGGPGIDRFAQQLALAADEFIVTRTPATRASARAVAGAGAAVPIAGRTVIAGYHWFNDWGRDTMIALPGLTLATGRPEDGAAILRSFAPYVRDGLLPNNFPDRAGVDPGYNTVDASLWYVLAIGRHIAATADQALLVDLLPVVREIVDRHRSGTRFGIGMADDGLLRAGEPGLQLTWMDVKIGEWVVTPRMGKPVEINALWYNVLRSLAAWLDDIEPGSAAGYRALAEQVRDSFRARFIREDVPHLADVIDGPDGDDWRLRPNQLLALSLPYPLLEGPVARRVIDACATTLLTSLGVRTLDPADPAYHGSYGGDRVARDAAYHQGTAWTWLMGPFVEAYLQAGGDPGTARSFLAPFVDHLRDAGLGTVSELAEGDPPHRPKGCIAQAWGVAEVLRAWRLLDERDARAPDPRDRPGRAVVSAGGTSAAARAAGPPIRAEGRPLRGGRRP